MVSFTSPDERDRRIAEIFNVVGAPLRRAGSFAGLLTNPLALGEAGQGFATAVQAARELLRAQLPPARAILGGKLDTISAVGGQLAVDAGKAATLDDGIVLFHEEISRDKPALRRIFRTSDRRAGRRPPDKISRGQRIMRLAVASGDVKRNKAGKFTGLKPAATRALKRERSRLASARNAAKIRRQATARAKLKGFL